MAHGHTTSNRTRTSEFLPAVLRAASAGELMIYRIEVSAFSGETEPKGHYSNVPLYAPGLTPYDVNKYSFRNIFQRAPLSFEWQVSDRVLRLGNLALETPRPELS